MNKTITKTAYRNAASVRTIVPRVRTIVVQRPRIVVKPRQSSLTEALVTSSYYVGKGIILFTMFYCSMNWVYYRGMRKDLEEAEKKEKETKDKKK